MTVSVGITACFPQPKGLKQKLLEKAGVKSADEICKDSNLGQGKNGNGTSLLSWERDREEIVSEVKVLSGQPTSPPNSNVNKCGRTNKAVKQGRAVSRGRRKSENKDYTPKSQGGGRSRGRKVSKSNRDYENSSSNGGNSGADGNGEDNGSEEDEDDDDGEEDDDDDEEDEDEEGDDDDDEEDEESKNEEDDDDISLNGNEKNGKSERKIKQEQEDQEMYPTGLQSIMAGLDGSNIPLADLLEKLPNSVCPGDEDGSRPVTPGVPVTLHGIVCHEIGGVLVVNIKWRNKFYCGSLLDCSRHAWASPRFPASDGAENEMKLGGKGGKGKRRQKNNSLSSSMEVVKEATPLKHKLRGRKRGSSGGTAPKSQGFKSLGKRRSKNVDDDDEGQRPGKRSCTIKTTTTVSPQPSPTLIECPEPGCDKKYKHINGLRYHQAHAHLEESNHSDERSASTSPSPVEEFKEPDTKPGFKGRTSRVSARARSISPSLAAAMATMSEKKSDALSRGSKKKETSETAFESAASKETKTSQKSPVIENDDDSNAEDTITTVVEISDKCQQACEHDIQKENNSRNKVEQGGDESKGKFKCIEDIEAAVESLEKENALASDGSHDVALSPKADSRSEVELSAISDTVKDGAKDALQTTQEVWETVIDSGFSVAKGSAKSRDLVEDVEKALSENCFSNKESANQLCIPGVQPVDLRQAVDAGVGLINQLGIEVEDISENEEDIDPGQDSEYTNKSNASLPSPAGMADQENTTGEKSSEEIPFAKRETALLKEDTNRNSPNDATSTLLESSFHFDIQTEKQITQAESKRNELRIKTENSSLASSVENKSTPVSEKLSKPSMEDLVSKSISRSAVEPPLINSDAPSMRYKFFECRNYGDEPNFDKFIRTSELDQKRTSEAKATLAPIRYPELVRSVPSSGISTISGNFTVTKASSTDISHTERKFSSKSLPIPSLISTTRSPIPEVLSKHSSVSDKPRTSVESKSPSVPKHLTPRAGVVSSSRSPSSISISGSKVHTLMSDRKNAPNPFQPVIVKHEFQSSEGSQGIKQEISSSSLSNSDSKSLLTQSGSDLGKQNIEFKGLLGVNESASTGSPRPSQEADDFEKSFKTTPKTLSRSHPTLISRSSNSLPPSLPVGVAHPYPRASDVVSHAKGSEQKTSVSGSSVTSVTFSSMSPITLPSSHDVSSELLQLEGKTKQLQTLQVPIPVGEVSPVSLKRSPGPAIHSGLPPVLPIIGPGIKSQGAVSSHPVVRSGSKTSGLGEQIRTERKNETSLRVPSPYNRSKSPIALSLGSGRKASPERKSPQPMALFQKARATEDSVREDTDTGRAKEDPLAYGRGKDKRVVEKDREKRDPRDNSAAELSFRSQEAMSAEQFRSLQLQQQLTLQPYYYQQFLQSGVPLEMLKNLGPQLEYMPGMHVDAKAMLAAQLCQNMQPEQQMQIMQLHRQMALEQEKQGMRSTGSSGQSEGRNLEKKDIQKLSDRMQEEKRVDAEAPAAKKSSQNRLHSDSGESEFHRFSAQSGEFASRSMSPKMSSNKLPPEEPAEKKSRLDESYERERELERQKYKREEEFLQRQKCEQRISFFNQLKNDLQKEQLGASFPRKRQVTLEKPAERLGSSREDERGDSGSRNTRDLIYHRPQDSSSNTAKQSENSSGQGSPRSQAGKSQSLAAARSPIPSSRHKADTSDEKERRDASSALPATNYAPTQIQAYLSQINFDPATGTLPYGAHQMLVGSQFALPPGLVISMPITSHGESSTVASVASSSREEERGPYRSNDRERSSTPTPHKSQPRASASETHERIQRLKDSEKDSRRSPVMFHEERSRNRSAASEQNVSPKSNSRPRDLKAEDGASHGRQGIISNNLAISRMAGHMDALTEEELMRRQRLAVDYSDPSLHMNYYPGLIRMDPAFATNMMQSSSQHIGRGMEHFITKRP
ncbi:zinc finger protein 608-like isoform X2 [Acropora muricata]|uniref:zinc finger protein 608-like isoform X2 n=1 Tax=Acropora muricata TaxID=159855 RepID=UPI0034E50420